VKLSITIEDPLSEDATALMEGLSKTLQEITGDSGKSSFSIDDLKNEKSIFLIARNSSDLALGCGSVRILDEKVGEIKRMFSKVPGVGTEILLELERRAITLGYESLRLETRKVNIGAVDFYLKRGYKIIENYGKYVGRENAICFEKILVRTL